MARDNNCLFTSDLGKPRRLSCPTPAVENIPTPWHFSACCVQNNWYKVHLSDELKSNLFESDGKCYIRCQTGERLNPKRLKKSVKGVGWRFMDDFSSWIQASYTATWNMTGWMQMFIRTFPFPSLQASPNQSATFIENNASVTLHNR